MVQRLQRLDHEVSLQPTVIATSSAYFQRSVIVASVRMLHGVSLCMEAKTATLAYSCTDDFAGSAAVCNEHGHASPAGHAFWRLRDLRREAGLAWPEIVHETSTHAAG